MEDQPETLINVPNHTPMGIEIERNPNPVNGPVEIMIVTYAKDLPWLRNTLHAMRKFCDGFQGITVVFPRHETAEFRDLTSAYGVRLFPFDQDTRKGFLHHMVMMASADLIVPGATRWVMHCDSDGIWHTPTTPENYFLEDKPVYLVRTWESLGRTDAEKPGGKVVSDCAQWYDPTEQQLGIAPRMYTMCRHPTVFPMHFYKRYRDRVAAIHPEGFEKYMLSGRNEFPQDRMDFTAMGAFAFEFMHDEFRWINVEAEPYPLDRQKTYWSRGGITPVIAQEIAGFMKRDGIQH